MVVSLQKSSVPSNLRTHYLDSLIEPQEYFLESLVSVGTTLTYGDSAYAVVSGDTLVEIYAAPNSVAILVEFFQLLVEECAVKRVLCKSYDTQLLNAAFSRAAKVSTAAHLFRRIVEIPSHSSIDSVIFRAGNQADIESVMLMNDDFFEGEDEVLRYLESDGFFVIELHNEVVGCGIGKPVVPGRNEIDIGMQVSQTHRNRGLGRHIVSCLKDHYLQLGQRPICGCGASNHASKKALEYAGFVSDHRLLSISY